MLILEVTSALDSFRVPYAIVGGYAVSLHGATRGTLDIDLIIPQEKKYYLLVEKALSSINLHSRLPVTATEVFTYRDEYIKNRNLIAWSFFDSHNPLRIVDVIITEDLNHVKTTILSIKNKKVKIITKEDLIKIKSKSGRPQDLEDVKALRKLQK
ncbi:MAG: nucleotidyltransferase [Proteobacteria bacterium]|nr:nucleotidyltransferase [Pseudomonadota bacterium]